MYSGTKLDSALSKQFQSSSPKVKLPYKKWSMFDLQDFQNARIIDEYMYATFYLLRNSLNRIHLLFEIKTHLVYIVYNLFHLSLWTTQQIFDFSYLFLALPISQTVLKVCLVETKIAVASSTLVNIKRASQRLLCFLCFKFFLSHLSCLTIHMTMFLGLVDWKHKRQSSSTLVKVMKTHCFCALFLFFVSNLFDAHVAMSRKKKFGE